MSGNRVLVVDDEPTILEMLHEVLEEEGFEVATAESGEASVEYVAGGSPLDLVLMDVMMPGISGVEAMGRIHRLRPGLPVVLISGGLPGVRPWPPPGAKAFFEKPLDLRRLVERLRALV